MAYIPAKTTHVSNFGSLRPMAEIDSNGYIEYHEHSKYNFMTDDELHEILEDSRYRLVRNAAAVELANRTIARFGETRSTYID